jgi:hypothetical protein
VPLAVSSAVCGKDASYLVNGIMIGELEFYDGFTPKELGLYVFGTQAVVFKSVSIEE